MISARLTPEYRHEASREITRQVLALPFWKQAETVMAYWSLPEEPDTRELMETALKEGKKLLLPRCLDATTMAAIPVKRLLWTVACPLILRKASLQEQNFVQHHH